MARVAIIYHFFPHYRRPVMEGLLALDRHHVVLVGDRDSTAHDPTIKAWVPADPARFVATRSRSLKGRLIWQSGVVGQALSRENDTVVFLASMNFVSTWVAAALARLAGKRVFFWAHGWTRMESGLKGLIRRRYFHLAERLLLYGRRGRQLALANGFRSERVQVIYNSLDYPAQAAARDHISEADRLALRREMFGDAEDPLVVCTTRLVRLRRLDLLLEAVAEVRQRHGRTVRVVLVGDGPERGALEAQARTLGVAVHFAGACYDEERIGRFIMASNCTVAPGKVGLTAMHSLAFGVPVLTHGDADDQMPEFEAVVPGITGDLFRPGDVSGMADAIARWTTSRFPSAEVSAACIRVIERFYNPQRQVELIAAALDGAPALETRGESIQAEELTA